VTKHFCDRCKKQRPLSRLRDICEVVVHGFFAGECEDTGRICTWCLPGLRAWVKKGRRAKP
jgi:hypothetical protein